MVIRLGNIELVSRKAMSETLYVLIAGFLFQPVYFFLLGTLSRAFSFPTAAFTYIYYGGLWLLLLLSIERIYKSLSMQMLTVTMFVVLGCCLQLLIFPKNKGYIVGLDVMSVMSFQPSSLITALPFLLIGIAVADTDRLMEILHTTGRIGVIGGVLAYGIAIAMGWDLEYDDMSNAYGICMMLCVLVANQKKGDLIFILLGIIALVLAGTRGPILCTGVAIILKMVWMERDSGKRILKLLIGAAALLFLSFGGLRWLLEMVAAGFASLGVEELRLVDYMNADMLTDSSGRDYINTVTVETIWKHPLLGIGAGGDRLVLPQGMYAHNLFLEMWLSFGIVVGSAILAWMLYMLCKAMFAKNPSLRMIALILISGVFVKLMLSSSYLNSKELFVLLGICMSRCAKRQRSSLYGNISENRPVYEGNR